MGYKTIYNPLLEDGFQKILVLDKTETGWIQVSDDEHTQSTPLTISSNVRTLLPNNAANVLNVTNPIGGSTWWANDKFNPDNSGDTYDLRVGFIADPTLNNRNLTLELDIGGTQGVIWSKTLRLARGAGVDTRIIETIDIFTLGTFIANGGEIFITCDGDVDIYDIVIKIERKYRA